MRQVQTNWREGSELCREVANERARVQWFKEREQIAGKQRTRVCKTNEARYTRPEDAQSGERTLSATRIRAQVPQEPIRVKVMRVQKTIRECPRCYAQQR